MSRLVVLSATSLGVVADRLRAPLVERARLLQVVAVFGQSFHLAGGDDLVAIGGPAIGDGPLNIVCPLPEGGWPGAGVAVGHVAAVLAERLAVAGGPIIELGAAQVWRPPPWPRRPTAAIRHARLAALADAAAPHLPLTGLVRPVLVQSHLAQVRLPGPPSAPPARPVDAAADAVARAAAAPIAALGGWLAAALAVPPSVQPAVPSAPGGAVPGVAGLLGLGPGLTPAGDDLLAGAMLALHALGAPDLAAALWRTVGAAGSAATTQASRAFLAAAADGHACAPVAAVLAALLTDAPPTAADDWPAHVARLDAVGHTSGWDMLAGLVLALAAACAAGPRPRR